MTLVTPSSFDNLLRQLPAHQQLWLALSGGLDSVVLLDLAAKWCKTAAKSLQVIHVHHGLSPHADQWAQFCQQRAQHYQQQGVEVEIQVYKVQLDRKRSSLEQQAREARYAVFEQQLQPNDLILMAHHADDQAETLLLRLLRGAGSQGLSAMPAYRPLGQGQLYRPLLGVTRDQLVQYAVRQQLDWVEDESNQCLDFDRNYLRHEILPRLKHRWPACSELFSRAALNLADSAQLNHDLAMLDLQQVRCSTPFGEVLSCDALQILSKPRQVNVLRHWFRAQGMPELEYKQWSVVFDEVIHAKIDAEPCFDWQGYQLRRFNAQLYLLPPIASFDANRCYPLATLPLPEVQTELYLPMETASFRLIAGAFDAKTPVLSLPESGRLFVRYRQGGESIVLAKRGRKLLKKLLQERAIPPWLRQRLPLLWWQPHEGEAQLLAVANLWVSAACMAPNRSCHWQLEWRDKLFS